MSEQVESNATATPRDVNTAADDIACASADEDAGTAAHIQAHPVSAASDTAVSVGGGASLTAPTCAIGYAFKAIEGKWKLPVMYVLSVRGAARYNEIKRELGITNMMLTNTLRDLEEYGLVSRTQYNEVPPRVEYALTANGYAIIPALKEFEKWGQRLLDARDPTGGDSSAE
ncbi:winged helix-turn-helix transcriptional regulator [Bifidobacterium biavatii]|uniref:Putative transcriptional regulator n=1 Tax=Bifidobacterium biavatii DSM 23969 TaxID=1437608 RepID=A0A087A0F5_9BIFI|nr:helix-turn-helix domain-containing protein [Bifidobacterium biavatii]KFI52255.1 putative transcriptional regulator [Bifidobacterium biavatii DSM 23969]